MSNEFMVPISGNITALNEVVDLTAPNSTTQLIQIEGTWTGTLVLEGSNDNTTYYSIEAIKRDTNTKVTNITTNGAYDANTNGWQFLRIRASAWTSGTANIKVYGSDAATFLKASVIESALPAGASTETKQDTQITNQTTLNTRVGDLTETAPASDTASSGLNGRLQRIAQRITSAISAIRGNEGTTTTFSGTATTTPANVPSTAGNVISGLGLDNTGNQDIQISMDGGTSYKTVGRGEFFTWDVKGGITQVQLKTLSSTSTYELTLNREA